MKLEVAAFLRTTLPLDLSKLDELDRGRVHSIWLPDHMVSFWPDSIWTPEFTDLATVSASPHRHLDGLAVAAAVAALTRNVSIATCVVDTVRRHPALLAQTALTIDHLARGRFILGLGSGETENVVPYGIDFETPVARFEEALRVIRMLWTADSPVDFTGRFYRLHHARMDTEPFAGSFPKIWVGAMGPRMLELTGRYADGWFGTAIGSAEEYASKLQSVRTAAQRAGRDPAAITSCLIQPCLIGDDDELAEILKAPLVKAYVLQIPAAVMRIYGFEHPMGDGWRGIQDIDPGALTRDKIIAMLAKVDVRSILAVVTHGTPNKVASILKGYVDAGVRVIKILDYGGMAGLSFAASSAAKVLQTENELLRLVQEA